MNHFWVFINYYVFLYPLYMSFVWSIGGLLFYFRRERNKKLEIKEFPFFSIIIPARNEEGCIKETVENLQSLNYSEYEVIVVNDGSTDKTKEIITSLISKYAWLRIINLNPNNGKANATNIGIMASRGEYILVIDADCFLDKDALRPIAWHFINSPRVGGVTGNPRVINRTSLLGKIQVGEYSSIIGLIKRSQRILGKILTVSGVIAAYRKSALYSCGFFDSDTVTEDIDMTWKLQKHFWDIRYEPRALCWILVPETLRGLWIQRLRWAQGGIEVIKKHFDIWFDWRQRRFWPIYIEYVGATFWAFALGILASNWLFSNLLYYISFFNLKISQNFIPVAWTGSILAGVCLLQSMVSLFIDSHYESKSMMKYYFWVIWYPFFYWIVNGIAVFFGFFNVFISKKGRVSIKWESPDRGLQTLQ